MLYDGQETALAAMSTRASQKPTHTKATGRRLEGAGLGAAGGWSLESRTFVAHLSHELRGCHVRREL